jgi:hypothetical protein
MADAKYVNEVGLFDELKLALSRTTADDLKAWSSESVSRVPTIAKRRIKNFGALVSGIGKAVGEEVGGGVNAWKKGEFATHIGQRTAAGIDTTLDFGKRTWRTLELVSKAVLDDPKKNAPGVLALALGFIAGSGGVDGNGGIPDTDIAMWGIGDHRSLFTHSIIAGIVVETSVLALADLAGIVCDKLPHDERSEFWEQISTTKDQIASQLSAGASAGIAYHLAVDATLQPAAYKDLPFSMPMEAHQMLFALNSAVEGNDAVDRVKSPGEKAVAAVSDGFAAVGSGLRALFGHK